MDLFYLQSFLTNACLCDAPGEKILMSVILISVLSWF